LKATAKAYAIQGLIKYHGLRDPGLRIPYHDSISVCMKSLPTITTVEADEKLPRSAVRINGAAPTRLELSRVEAVLSKLRQVARKRTACFRVSSRNPNVNGKGLGFSAAGFAALGLAASAALGLSLPPKELSQIVRLGAGSAARSLTGGFSIWYANKNHSSYSEQLAPAKSIPLRTVIAPIPSKVKTDRAHEDSVKSPLYKARLRNIDRKLAKMKRAITKGDVGMIGRLAEEDTLSLHAVTMTGPRGMVLFSPLSITIINEVRRLREEEDLPAWFSLDTGPSVFINTAQEVVAKVRRTIGKLTDQVLTSDPGGPAVLLDKHLF
jgi:phosphomevalonate decarboxylase